MKRQRKSKREGKGKREVSLSWSRGKAASRRKFVRILSVASPGCAFCWKADDRHVDDWSFVGWSDLVGG